MRQRVAQLHVGEASGRTTNARRMPAERAERFHLLPGGGIPHSATRGVQRVCGALRFEGLGHGLKKQACWLVFPRTGRAHALSARRAPVVRASGARCIPTYVQPTTRGGIPHSATRGVQRFCGALRFEGLGHGPKKQACWLVFPRTGRDQALSARRAPVGRATDARCIAATYVQPKMSPVG